VNSRTTASFRETYAALPANVRRRAREAYKQFCDNPNHPGLRRKRVHATMPVYAVRVTRDYRALGVRDGDDMIWFWIGSHTDYERVLRQL